MNEKILQAIVELVSSGGTAAIWVYAIYVAGAVLKFVIGFGCILAGIRYACKTALNIAEGKNVCKENN